MPEVRPTTEIVRCPTNGILAHRRILPTLLMAIGAGLLDAQTPALGPCDGDQSSLCSAPSTAKIGIGLGSTGIPATALDVSGVIGQRPPVASTMDNYMQTNAAGAASPSLLNPGLSLFSAPGYHYGMDLGFNGRYRTRIFANTAADISFGFHAQGNDPISQSSITDAMTIRGDTGNVGVGTSAPQATLDVYGGGMAVRGSTVPAASVPGMWLAFDGTASHIYSLNQTVAWKGLSIDGSSLILNASSGGNVGIGTTNPQHPLQVNGTIGATEVVVSSTGADYVFQPDYRLRPLSEVAEYIDQNHHLPDIPSAKEVQSKGMSLGEMQAKLLAKIEELTLHQIELERQNAKLEQQVGELRARVDNQRSVGSEERAGTVETSGKR